MYKNAVPYPNGQVAAEELFHLGIIPSDTDFRIFRDYGHIPGMIYRLFLCYFQCFSWFSFHENIYHLSMICTFFNGGHVFNVFRNGFCSCFQRISIPHQVWSYRLFANRSITTYRWQYSCACQNYSQFGWAHKYRSM